MMKFSIIIPLLLWVTLSNAQHVWLESRLTCDKSKAPVIAEARQAFAPVLNTMVREGLLLNWDSGDENKGEKIEITYYLTVNPDDQGKTFSEYLKRASAGQPELYKSFMAACPTRKDTIRMAVRYPWLKENLYEVTAVVPQVDEVPDPSLQYNVVIDFTAFPRTAAKRMDSASVNTDLTDIGRIMNLHAAAGIPKNNIHFVVAVHGSTVRSFFTDEAYRKKFKRDNPNAAVIRELHAAGVKFLLCGQSLTWLGIDRKLLMPETKVTLTAQTTLTSYQLKGYALKVMSND